MTVVPTVYRVLAQGQTLHQELCVHTSQNPPPQIPDHSLIPQVLMGAAPLQMVVTKPTRNTTTLAWHPVEKGSEHMQTNR